MVLSLEGGKSLEEITREQSKGKLTNIVEKVGGLN